MKEAEPDDAELEEFELAEESADEIDDGEEDDLEDGGELDEGELEDDESDEALQPNQEPTSRSDSTTCAATPAQAIVVAAHFKPTSQRDSTACAASPAQAFGGANRADAVEEAELDEAAVKGDEPDGDSDLEGLEPEDDQSHSDSTTCAVSPAQPLPRTAVRGHKSAKPVGVRPYRLRGPTRATPGSPSITRTASAPRALSVLHGALGNVRATESPRAISSVADKATTAASP